MAPQDLPFTVALSMLHMFAEKILSEIIFPVGSTIQYQNPFIFLSQCSFLVCLIFFCLCEFPSDVGIPFYKNLHAVYF